MERSVRHVEMGLAEEMIVTMPTTSTVQLTRLRTSHQNKEACGGGVVSLTVQAQVRACALQPQRP